MKLAKAIFVVWIAIYPPLTLLLWLFGSPLQRLPLPLRTFVLTAILVPFMVAVLVPFWTKRLDWALERWSRWRSKP